MTVISTSDPTGPGVPPAAGSGPVDLARATSAAGAFLAALGFDLDHPDTAATPERMARAWVELVTPQEFDATEFTAPTGCNGLVVVRQITFVSVCEHHGLPFRGEAAIGYLPGKQIVGLSKLARVVDWFARRPQVQERLTAQIADWLITTLAPEAVGVHLSAEHLCMSLRGARAATARTETSAFRGALVDDDRLHAAWLAHLHPSAVRA